MADTLAELQAQVDGFDVIYNTQRPPQGLPGRNTPRHGDHINRSDLRFPSIPASRWYVL